MPKFLLTITTALLACGSVFANQQAPVGIAVYRIAAGPGGRDVNGTFVLNDERSVFNRTDDREIVVLFQWNGSAGAHKLVAQWRSPDGGQSSNSAIDYVAREPRFGAYWSLPLTPSTALGLWSIEATVDGLPAGRMTFEVTDRKVPSAVVKRPLTEAELYAQLSPVFAVLQRQSAGGRDLELAAGFTADGRLYTAFSAVDGAGVVQMSAEGRASQPLTSLVAWHRLEDWAVAVSGGPAAAGLPRAPQDATKVGDRCFSMGGSLTGGRVLSTCSITGLRTSPVSFIATFSGGEAMTGAPVANEFGELIGIVGGAGVPGVTRLLDMMRFRAELRGIPIVPLSRVRVPVDAPSVTFEALRTRGELVAPTEGGDNILDGGFTRTMPKNAMRSAFETRDDFSLRDKSFVAYVTWTPRERLRGQLMWKVFDVDGRLVLTSKPQKTDLRKDMRATSMLDIPMFSVAGIYRVEAYLDAKCMWRGFVRITP